MKPTVILITGYARSGKDTFANALEHNCIKAISQGKAVFGRHAFADTLKNAANGFLHGLGLGDHSYRKAADGIYEGPFFHDEEFKKKHRQVLVELGRMARSIDVDVFARQTAVDIYTEVTDPSFDGLADVEVVTDWRYINELRVMKDRMGESIRVVTVRVHTEGVHPANEEEALSIAAIQSETYFDAEFGWRMGEHDAIDKCARMLLDGIGFPLNG